MAGSITRPVNYRGMSKLAYVLGTRLFHRDNTVTLDIDGHSRVRVLLRDGYWVNLLFSKYEYEPEIAFVLLRVLCRSNVCFVDCGANIGYWSIVSSNLISEPGKVLAIEASPHVFERLVDNAALNDNRFRCIRGAVWSSDGESLEIISHDQRHAGSSVVTRREKREEFGYQVDKVRSQTLDTITDLHIPPDLHVVLKLDVEGAEIDALRGARRLLAQRTPLVLYEDHGNDSENLVTRYILEELKMNVFYCQDRRLHRIPTVETIHRIKVNSGRGYNFIACSPDSNFAKSLVDLSSE